MLYRLQTTSAGPLVTLTEDVFLELPACLFLGVLGKNTQWGSLPLYLRFASIAPQDRSQVASASVATARLQAAGASLPSNGLVLVAQIESQFDVSLARTRGAGAPAIGAVMENWAATP